MTQYMEKHTFNMKNSVLLGSGTSGNVYSYTSKYVVKVYHTEQDFWAEEEIINQIHLEINKADTTKLQQLEQNAMGFVHRGGNGLRAVRAAQAAKAQAQIVKEAVHARRAAIYRRDELLNSLIVNKLMALPKYYGICTGADGSPRYIFFIPAACHWSNTSRIQCTMMQCA